MASQYKQILYLGFVLTWVFQISGFLIGNLNDYTCDVERNSCNYTIKGSTDGLLKWTRHTVTRVSKPTTDHTLNGLGHVFNVQTSSRTRIFDKTTLHSPVMTGLLGNTAIGFWYSISASGTSAMNFTVLAKTTSATKPVTIFTRLVHGIVHWTPVCYILPVYGGLDLTFEARALHSGVIGDLAIDDITIKPGNFCTSSHVTSPPPTAGNSVTCDFDTSMCGYTNIATASRDDFNWTRHRGTTVSVDTGPTGDHTSHHGYYMYIETSSPRKPGENALLESPSFPTNGPQYVSFWYNAYGSSVGSLKVYVGYGTYLGTPLFTASLASSTSAWRHGCIEVPQRHITSHVVFEGVVGSSYKGDIAIDDVTLGTGSCRHPIITTTAPTVNGHWGSWSSYSSCSVSCGTGNVTSTRSCSHPAPSNGGLQCPGSATRQSICHQPTCPIDGHWSSWGSYGSCTATCGQGYQMSHRTCTNPVPRYGGHQCSGTSTRTLTCRNSDCPVDGRWGSWGAWGACSVTCGSGNVTSTRLCNKPAPSNGGHSCVGISSKQDSCQMTSCTVDGGWSDWTTWSKCSTSCALGAMSRDRSCSYPVPSGGGKQCTGDHVESHECSLGPCPTWSHWYQGDCSSTCGNGTAERMRSCSTGNNADCTGISYTHVPCFGIEFDGEWGPWLAYSECTVTCSTGIMYSSRACTNPAPKNNGRDCVGNFTRETECVLASCSVDGGWALWTTWSDCTTSCGLGTLSRVRVCSNPRPLGDGKRCPGDSTETHECSKGLCPTWASWFSHPCSVTCGSGTMERMRTCSTKNNGDCTGEYYEIVPCETVSCTSMVTVQVD